MSKKLVVFDFDGTLVDSFGCYEEALKEFSEARNLPYSAEKMTLGYTNPSKNDLGWGVSLQEQEVLFEELNTFFYEETLINDRFMPQQFEHVDVILKSLSENYDLGVITARNRNSLVAILEKYQWTNYFPHYRSLCCARDRGYDIKPAPDAVHCLVRDTQHAIDDIIVIGDTTSDVMMARNAGVKSIGVLWGAHTRDMLVAAEADIILDDVTHLPDAITQLFTR